MKSTPKLLLTHGSFEFALFSLLWLPVSVIILGLLQGIPLPMAPPEWLLLALIAPLGFPLAFACQKLRWINRPNVAWIMFIALAPVTAQAVIMATFLFQLLPLAVIIISAPAWTAYILFRPKQGEE